MTARTVIVAADEPAALVRAAAQARDLGPEGVDVVAVVVAESGACLFPRGTDVTGMAERLSGVADTVAVYEGSADQCLQGIAASEALVAAAKEWAADLVLLVDGPLAREAAGRAAVRLRLPCVGMCEKVEYVGDRITIDRAVYGGAAAGRLEVAGGAAVCVLAGGGDPLDTGTGMGTAPGIVERPAPTPGVESECRLIAEEPLERSVDLAEARKIVSVGRGLARADDIGIIDGLASALGAELGCSRPLAEDFKWLPKERMVGLTGTSVAPLLYLAVGISGQVQHLAGIRGAKVVAAVNTDPKSPIVRNADYTVIGDLYAVVPALVAALSARPRG